MKDPGVTSTSLGPSTLKRGADEWARSPVLVGAVHAPGWVEDEVMVRVISRVRAPCANRRSPTARPSERRRGTLAPSQPGRQGAPSFRRLSARRGSGSLSARCFLPDIAAFWSVTCWRMDSWHRPELRTLGGVVGQAS